jgi:prevent-host-death family protein
MTKAINIGEAKSQLSKLVARAQAGEEIWLAKDGTPVARLTALPSLAERRKSAFGLWKGLYTPEQIAFMTGPLPPEEQAALENAGLDEDWSIVPPPNTPPEGTNPR